MTEEDLVNYKQDVAMMHSKEEFATDYATVAKNWNLSPCGVVDDETRGMTEEDLVNYKQDVAMMAGKDNFAVSFDKLISR